MTGDDDAPASFDDQTNETVNDHSRTVKDNASVDPIELTVNHESAGDDQLRTVSADDNDLQQSDLDLSSDFFASEATRIGRYRIDRQLGIGGFGSVYLATDTELRRRVAIKIPHPSRLKRAADVDKILAEARTVAALDHPGVVPIYDFGHYGERCFIVSKYIEGQTLSDWIQAGGGMLDESVRILKSVADTLQFLHQAGVIHRDVKPQNLLLDQTGMCFLTDFGLALQDHNVIRQTGRIGTYAYMSPEQARGESHLVDRRSDLFSLGVVMYEMLCGRRPFDGDSWNVVLSRICDEDPIPLRQIDPKIPKELERICLKLLSKRTSSRYDSASGLAEDLAYFLEQNSTEETAKGIIAARSSSIGKSSTGDILKSSEQLIGIVPRGLRSFDEQDAGYFTALLPGPCDRSGLPDSLAVWKNRIESTDQEKTFRLGVIYGCSGSGKSSFVRAGLIPILEPQIESIVINASGQGTEERLLETLRDARQDLPGELTLAESLGWIRQHWETNQESICLIVIDQFEQWLHTNGGETNSELAIALRQCDGRSLKCVLLVRDDYWVGVSRFVDDMDIDLVRSRNLSMIDLFDQRHARKVLAEYGRGFDRLPENLTKLTADQSSFLDAAVEGLSHNAKVIPVQLVTFAEIMKSRPWNKRSLQEVGGTDGVGVQFLEESFGENAPAESRSHLVAVENVLSSLLPEAGTDIKGAMRSEQELRSVSGYREQRRRFSQMIALLDSELRLITPTDSNGDDSAATKSYQLTHDFLVPAIRQWLRRKQGATIRGRAKLRLADRAEIWSSRRENRHLPSWIEWLSFSTLTERDSRSEVEQRMMSTATKRHLIVTAIGLVLTGLVGLVGYEMSARSRTNSLIQQLRTADTREAGGVLDRLQPLMRWSQAPLAKAVAELPIESSGGLHARLAMMRKHPEDDELFDAICDRLLSASIQVFPLIRNELEHHPRLPNFIERLWQLVESPSTLPTPKLNAAIALARFVPPPILTDTPGVPAETNPLSDPNHARWAQVADELTKTLLERIADRPQDYFLLLAEISEFSGPLFEPLFGAFRNTENPELRAIALDLAIDLYSDRTDYLVEFFYRCDESELVVILPSLDEISNSSLRAMLLNVVNQPLDDQLTPADQQDQVNQRINAAVFLLRHGETKSCWQWLKANPNPGVRSGLIERAAHLSVDPDAILRQLQISDDPSVRSALLLMLGSIPSDRLTPDQAQHICNVSRRIFVDSNSAQVHSAAQWLLERLQGKQDNQKWLIDKLSELRRMPDDPNRQWTIAPNGQTLIRFQYPSYVLEVSATETSFNEFWEMKPTHGEIKINDPAMAPIGEHPVMVTTWWDAVKYCRWRTFEDGLEEEDQCYPPIDPEIRSLEMYPEALQRRGYRLLTPKEWMDVCFAGATTRFGWGHDWELDYAYGRPAGQYVRLTRVTEMKPLPSGLFGMYGGVREWCSFLSPHMQRFDGPAPLCGPDRNDDINVVLKMTKSTSDSAANAYYSIGFRICRSVPKVD